MRAHEAGELHAEIGAHLPAWLREPADVNALLPQLWPGTVRRAGNGVLTVADIPVTDLAASYGTPVYVLDEADLRHRARSYRDAFAAAFRSGAETPSRPRPLASTVRVASTSHSRACVNGVAGSSPCGRMRHAS